MENVIKEEIVVENVINEENLPPDGNDIENPEEAGDKLKGRKKKKKFVDYNHNNNSNNNNKKYSKKSYLDPNFNYEESYFEKDLLENEWRQIHNYANDYYNNKTSVKLEDFLNKFTNLRKGSKNIQKLKDIFIQTFTNSSGQQLDKYKNALNIIIEKYYNPTPFIKEVIFFPDENNENKVVNMIRTAKKSLNVCIYTFTNDKLAEAIEEAFVKNKISIRIITDDETIKQKGSDISKLVLLGIPCKTDDNSNYYMHHKFVIIDGKVLITGSFNWTVQAVKYNNENVIMIQDEELAEKYEKEFERLWNEFKHQITNKEANELKNNINNI